MRFLFKTKLLALFLLLIGLIKVSEARLFKQGDLFVRVSLVVKFERVIGIREVLFGQLFDFRVGLNPVEELCAVRRVLSISCLVSLKCFVVLSFLFQCCLPSLSPDKYLAR